MIKGFKVGTTYKTLLNTCFYYKCVGLTLTHIDLEAIEIDKKRKFPTEVYPLDVSFDFKNWSIASNDIDVILGEE